MVLQIEGQGELNDAHHALFASGAAAGGWMLFAYTGPDSIRMRAASADGVESLAKQFRADEIQYALIRIDVPTTDGKQETRDVFVAWTGPDVQVIEKGRKAHHRSDVAAQLPDHDASVRAEDVKRFNLEK